jgi:hypothetical protein
MSYEQPHNWCVTSLLEPSAEPLSRRFLHQGHAKMCNWPNVVHAARSAMESDSRPTYQADNSRSQENKLISCLNQVCQETGAIYKHKICYNFGAAAFCLSYFLDVRLIS